MRAGPAARCLGRVRAWGLAGLMGLAGCAALPPEIEPPPMPRVATPFAVDALWYRQAQPTHPGGFRQPGPLLHEGIVVHVDRADRILAFDPASGREVWRRTLRAEDGRPLHINTRPGGGDGTVFIGTRQGTLHAFRAADGKRLWMRELDSEVSAPPIGQGGLLVARAGSGQIYGLDPETGALRWTQDSVVPPLSLQGSSRPVLVDERVFVGLDNGRLVGIAGDDGEVLWETTVGTPEGRSEFERLVDLDADPAYDGRALYVAAYQKRLAAVSPASGRILWSRDLSTHQGLRLDGARLYVSTDEGAILGMDPDNGTILWRQDALEGRLITAPVLFEGMVAVADFRGYLHFLSREDGRLLGRARVSEAGIVSDPRADGDRLYVVDADGAIQALRLSGARPEAP